MEKRNDKKEAFPPYLGGGERLPAYPCRGGGELLCVQNVAPDEAETYLARVCEAGFRPARESTIDGNRFQWYRVGRETVCLSYLPRVRTLRVVSGLKMKTQDPPEHPPMGKRTVGTAVTQLQLRLGMSYCVTLRDGTFLMIDGGLDDAEDAERLYAFLRAQTPENEKPVVRTWFITHTHPDHTRLAEDFMERYRRDVDLLETVYNFPDFAKIPVLRESAEGNLREVERFEATVRECYPGAAHFDCRAGDVLCYPGVRVTTLMTHEDVYPIPINSSNHTSSVWRFDFESGRSFMCLADLTTETCERLVRTYSAAYLKADVMQVVHHGLLGGHIDLYRAIDPDICLWPSPKERFLGTWTDPRRVAVGKPTVQFCIGEGGCDYNVWLRDDAIKKRAHFHAGETVTIPM